MKQVYVWCPPVKFTMGTPGATDHETPADVTLDGFWIAQTETTQSQFTAVQGANAKPWSGKIWVKEGPNFPASYVDYVDATAWCDKLTQTERAAGRLPEGWKYALPTEAQWEYACRAGTTGDYSFDGGEEKLGEYAWFDQNTWDIGEKYAHEVKTKLPNPWGLHDVHGNLCEWTHDAYQAKLQGGTNPFVDSGEQAAFQVFRGGSWLYASVRCRSANRNRFPPSFRYSFLGFRPVIVPVEPSK